jgi:hypothetical protein
MSDENELLALTTVGRKAPHRTLIYGANGVGKTTFCSKAKNVYFIAPEEGANEIRVPQYKEKITSLALMYTVIGLLKTKKHPYENVCIDGATATEQLIIKAIEDRLKKSASSSKDPKTIEDLNDDYGSGYIAISNEWKSLLIALDDLRDSRGMNILFCAHSKFEKVINLEGKDYERVTLELIGQRSIKALTNWADNVLYARQDVSVAEEKKKVLATKGGLSLYTRGTATYQAKTRGEIPWPNRLHLDYDTFDRLRDLVTTYGKDLPNHLTDWFNKLEKTIPSDRRENAKKAFNEFIEKGQWHLADAVCVQAQEESNAS